MEQQFDFEVLVKLKQKKRRRIWKRVLSAMMCMVVFCTTYMLILPAITKEVETFCGIEEHQHSEACYGKVQLCEYHTHTAECFAQSELICTEQTDDGHIHDETCEPVSETKLTCGLEETSGHIHTESCGITERVVVCGLEESEGHIHTESCSVTEKVLGCQQEESAEHTHSDSCYTEVTSNICGLEETEGHAHDDSCYSVETSYICGFEETEGHTHGDGCYSEITAYGCGLEEVQPSHTHTEACYAAPEQICTIEVDPEHVHTDECYGTELTCSKEEHVHSLICFSDPSADIESEPDWKATLPELTGVYAQDVLEIAKSQFGYTESVKNYIVDEDNTVIGYTRFGAWYGIPYDDWNATFVSFCMYYAGVEEIPQTDNSYDMANGFAAKELYKVPSEYVPKAGDIVFFDMDADRTVDRVGIAAELVDTDLSVVEGDSNNSVEINHYELHDSRIVGYGALNEILPQQKEPEDSEKPVEEPAVAAPEGAKAWATLVEPAETAKEEPQVAEQSVTAEKSVMKIRSGAANSKMRMASSAFSVTPRIGEPLNLGNYIVAVKMYDVLGNELPSGSQVSEGDLVEFEIIYSIRGEEMGYPGTVETKTLVYNLPGMFKEVKNTTEKIYDGFQEVGFFEVNNETKTITITFSDAYAGQNADGIQINGGVKFSSVVTKITEGDSEEQDYKFTDNITVGVVIEEKREAVGDLKIEKKEASVSGEEIIYEVTVTSTEGTNGTVTLTDQMSKGLTFKEGLAVLDSRGVAVNGVSFEASSDRSSFTMTLPDMEPGDSYTVRYSCMADINLLDADMTVRNNASVTGKDSEENELKDEATVKHFFDILKKDGEDNGDGTTTWKIVINEAKADISGWQLLDSIDNGDGNGYVSYTGTVTIKGSNGNIVANNVRLPYTFPRGSKDTYTVTYTTPSSFSANGGVYNKAILKDDDTEITVVKGVDIGTPITKTGEAGEPVQDANGNYLLPITWTVTIDTSNGPIPSNIVLIDKMYGDSANDGFMTYEQLMAACENIDNAVFAATGSETGWFEAYTYEPGPSVGDVYGYFDLINNKDNCHSFLFERFNVSLGVDIPQGKVLTFTYQTYGVFDNNIVSAAIFKNKFSLSERYEVEGRVDYTAGTIMGTKFAIKHYDPNSTANQDWTMDWGAVEGTSEFEYKDLHEDYLAWAIELRVKSDYSGIGNVTIIEDLPEGVSIKRMDLNFLCDLPTSRLKFENMVPGGTYTKKFDVYPPDQYALWEGDRTGKHEISIVVKVTEAGDLEITMPAIIFNIMAAGDALDNTIDEWWAYLYIYTQINEDFAWTPQFEGSMVYLDSFENRFTIKNDNGDVVDIGSQTQKIKKDETEKVVRKSASVDENNIIKYSVVLNEAKRDLIENSSAIRIHDELKYISTDAQPLRVRLVPGSVKLYEISVNSDGSYTKLNEITTNYSYRENSSVQYGITTWVHTIDFNAPDGKSLLLEYSYKADGLKQVLHNVLNTCSITGVGEGSIEGDNKVEVEVKDAAGYASLSGVMLYKVDAANNGVFLKDARFNIYIWNEKQNDYVIVCHPNGESDFVTDANGRIVLDDSTIKKEQFAYNTAYYIVEVESPNGYYLGPERYYFYIVNKDLLKYPSNIPDNFEGDALTTGDIIYRENVKGTTEISIEKYWKNYNGNNITVTGDKVPSVTVELWQMLEGNPNSAKVYGTYTMTPDSDGNWSLTIKDLPKAIQNSDGTEGTKYLYYITEVGVAGFNLESSTNNEGINSGTIKLFNRELEGYELPETGGIGTDLYTAAGLTLITISAGSMIILAKKRRKNG